MDLAAWYKQPLGRTVAAAEQAQLHPWLIKLFGYHILQCGAESQQQWLKDSPILQHLYLNPEAVKHSHSKSIKALYQELPFKENSIDVVLLAHVLELSKRPEQILQEACRVLIPDGHLIILSFNPWSLWRLLDRFKHTPVLPTFNLKWSFTKICRYLQINDFAVLANKNFLYVSPSSYSQEIPKLDRLEKLGQRLCPWLGAVRIIVAKKITIPLTPIKTPVRLPKIKVLKKVPEPIVGARNIKGD
jgi:SAM-dependent methyltransferase